LPTEREIRRLAERTEIEELAAETATARIILAKTLFDNRMSVAMPQSGCVAVEVLQQPAEVSIGALRRVFLVLGEADGVGRGQYQVNMHSTPTTRSCWRYGEIAFKNRSGRIGRLRCTSTSPA
jgi:hypothetical protein